MTKKLVVFSIIIVSSVALILSIAFGFRAFTTSIYQQRTCEWANIDNLEMHAKVDVPKIFASDCEYVEATNTKKAYFLVDKSKLDLERYLRLNKLKSISNRSEIPSGKFLNFDETVVKNQVMFYKENKKDSETSFVLFNSEAGKLYVTVQYASAEKEF